MNAQNVYGRKARMQYSDVSRKYVPHASRSSVFSQNLKALVLSGDTNAEAPIPRFSSTSIGHGKLLREASLTRLLTRHDEGHEADH